MIAVGIIFLSSFFILSLTMPIIQDDQRPDLITQKISEAYFQRSNQTLSYSFDISPLLQASDLLSEIRNTCSKYHFSVQSFEHQLLDISLWYDKNTSRPINTNFSRLSTDIDLIRINLDKFTNHVGTGKCKLLPNITRNIYKFNSAVILFSKSNFSLFHELISKEQFHTDVQKTIYNKNKDSSILPFDLNENFQNFFKFSRTEKVTNANILSLVFNIPLFSKTKQNINQIIPKPIIYKNSPYILKPNSTIMLVDTGRLVLHSNESVNESCKTALNKTFCDFPEFYEEKNFLSYDYNDFFYNFRIEHFERLPRRNIVTRIKNDFYFTVITPFDLLISCPHTEFSVRVTKSSKIMNNTECTLKSLFFEFEPKDNGNEYMILITDLLTNNEEIWENEEYGESNQKGHIYLLYFILICILIIITITTFTNLTF